VNGCFWHQHGCCLTKTPSTNQDFWKSKLERNVDRDTQNVILLMLAGWRVALIWECALRGNDAQKSTAVLFEAMAIWIRNQPNCLIFEQTGSTAANAGK
jgi:DNA mismatch endonuclease (patch repair protein)